MSMGAKALIVHWFTVTLCNTHHMALYVIVLGPNNAAQHGNMCCWARIPGLVDGTMEGSAQAGRHVVLTLARSNLCCKEVAIVPSSAIKSAIHDGPMISVRHGGEAISNC